MSAPRVEPTFTVDEYLRFEREAEERHIYVDGEIYAMAGESPSHADVSANLLGLLYSQLRGTPCRGRTKDTKVRSGPSPVLGNAKRGLYSYPDIVVICGEPEYHDAEQDVVLNPTVVIEVLSPSTEAFDRGVKFERYQKWNPTLRDFLLVSQDRPEIDHFIREPDGGWTPRRYVGLETEVVIESIQCRLRLADVYERVQFEVDGAGR